MTRHEYLGALVTWSFLWDSIDLPEELHHLPEAQPSEQLDYCNGCEVAEDQMRVELGFTWQDSGIAWHARNDRGYYDRLPVRMMVESEGKRTW